MTHCICVLWLLGRRCPKTQLSDWTLYFICTFFSISPVVSGLGGITHYYFIIVLLCGGLIILVGSKQNEVIRQGGLTAGFLMTGGSGYLNLASQIWCRSIFRLMAIVGSRRRSGI
jgi:hypothetical protein